MSKEDSKPDIIKFMLGEDEFDGLWFGDIKSGSPFWWRKPLRNYRDFIEKELSELKKQNETLANSLEKLINGLAKDGVAIEGFTDAWNALLECRRSQLCEAIAKFPNTLQS